MLRNAACCYLGVPGDWPVGLGGPAVDHEQLSEVLDLARHLR
ncbi:hypothetical protein [Plantactinospora sp. B5E13]